MKCVLRARGTARAYPVRAGLPHDGPVASGPCVGIVTSQSHVSMDTHIFFCLILI